MTPRNILMTTDAVGGVWQYSCDLACELAGQGHRITLAVMGPSPSTAQRSALTAPPRIRLVETGLPLDWLCDGPAPVEAAARWLAAMARDEGCDVVHCNMPSLAGAADWPVPLVAVAHGCVSTWWEAAKRVPLDPQFGWHRDMTLRGFEAADAVVAPSRSYADTVARYYGLPRKPRVVLNGRRALASGTPAEQPLHGALTVGRLWDPCKNAALLDKVARGLGAPFLAAGALRGPHGEEVVLRHLAGLGEIGSDQLASLLAQQPVFVSAASFEPFGLAVLEAAAAGCALVLSDIPTFRELWGGAALFVPQDDAAGFETAIRTLLDDGELRQRAGLAAKVHARRYTPTATAGAIAGIYDEVLDRPIGVAA